ncbi:MAG: signal peptide peptidase SppA [Candidatus Entotheonellia bacterium]
MWHHRKDQMGTPILRLIHFAGLTRRMALVLLALATAGCITLNIPGGKPGDLKETVIEGERGPKVALIEIEGLLRETGKPLPLGLGREESPVARVRAQLDKAAKDGAVKAVVLRIHSPGGTATASEIIYGEIQRFKAKKPVPVLAHLVGIATSGAYYAAMAADSVYANPTTVTGSIGVIFVSVNVSGLMEKLGLADQTLTTGPYKDVGSPLRPMSPEDRALMQGVLNDLYRRFVQVVAAGRPQLPAARVAELADGRIYSATQAQANGLIDGVADLPGTIDEVRRRAGLEEVRVVTYHRKREWRENLYTLSPSLETLTVKPTALLDLLPAPTFAYLWWPGID